MTSELKPIAFLEAYDDERFFHDEISDENLFKSLLLSLENGKLDKAITPLYPPYTRAVPDVPELVRYRIWFDSNYNEIVDEDQDGEYVRHSQAAKIIAAKQADYDAEYNSLVEQHTQAVKTIESWIDTCAELEKRSEDLKADAARYQYLRSRDVETIRKGGVFAGVTPENYVINGIDLDIAIDLAMKADKLDVKGESNV